jgi:hypothetical protein
MRRVFVRAVIDSIPFPVSRFVSALRKRRRDDGPPLWLSRTLPAGIRPANTEHLPSYTCVVSCRQLPLFLPSSLPPALFSRLFPSPAPPLVPPTRRMYMCACARRVCVCHVVAAMACTFGEEKGKITRNALPRVDCGRARNPFRVQRSSPSERGYLIGQVNRKESFDRVRVACSTIDKPGRCVPLTRVSSVFKLKR